MTGYFILVNRKGLSPGESKGVRMIKKDILCDGMLNVCLKLQTLRDSCSSIFGTQTYPPSLTWFNGAAGICQEAIVWIEEVVLILSRAEELQGADHYSDD
jgi:hypothetical protein